jgi:hypothetical protein
VGQIDDEDFLKLSSMTVNRDEKAVGHMEILPLKCDLQCRLGYHTSCFENYTALVFVRVGCRWRRVREAARSSS